MGWINVLDNNSIQGTVNAIPDGDKWGGEKSAVSFDNEPAFAEGEALLGRSGCRCGGGGGYSWCRLC